LLLEVGNFGPRRGEGFRPAHHAASRIMVPAATAVTLKPCP
jgi:hypothetical protein